MRVFKEFRFEAAHSLPHLPASHKCSRLHGHSYRVRLTYEGVPDVHRGFVIDYADITRAWGERCKPSLDHRNINDTLGDQSTAERLAKWIWRRMANIDHTCDLVEVEVRETATAGAIYVGPGER